MNLARVSTALAVTFILAIIAGLLWQGLDTVTEMWASHTLTGRILAVIFIGSWVLIGFSVRHEQREKRRRAGF